MIVNINIYGADDVSMFFKYLQTSAAGKGRMCYSLTKKML